jgi:hypothetical protein
MSKKTVLFELFDDNTRRIEQLLADIEPACLHWSIDGQANSIAVTIWHATRVLDVFITRHIKNLEASHEIWLASGWAEQAGYDPRGIGTNGWGAIIGYTLEEVRDIPQMDAELLLGYYQEVVGRIRHYLNTVTDQELEAPSKGFDGRQPNYFWVRHPLFDLTRHVGEILALKAIWQRR